MKSNYPKGTEGAAEEKVLKAARIAMAAATVVLAFLWFTLKGLKQEAHETPVVWKVISFICFIVCALAIVFEPQISKKTKQTTWFYVVWFFSLLGFLTLRIIGGV